MVDAACAVGIAAIAPAATSPVAAMVNAARRNVDLVSLTKTSRGRRKSPRKSRDGRGGPWFHRCCRGRHGPPEAASYASINGHKSQEKWQNGHKELSRK